MKIKETCDLGTERKWLGCVSSHRVFFLNSWSSSQVSNTRGKPETPGRAPSKTRGQLCRVKENWGNAARERVRERMGCWNANMKWGPRSPQFALWCQSRGGPLREGVWGVQLAHSCLGPGVAKRCRELLGDLGHMGF